MSSSVSDRAEVVGPAEVLLRHAADQHPTHDPKALQVIEFMQTEDGDIALDEAQDFDLLHRISKLLGRDRGLGSGSLDQDWLCVLLREPVAETSGAVFVGKRLALERLVQQAFEHRITRAEIQLILQTLAGLSLQLSAVRDRVSIETKKSQSKSVLSKLGFPDLGNLRVVLLARLLTEVMR